MTVQDDDLVHAGQYQLDHLLQDPHHQTPSEEPFAKPTTATHRFVRNAGLLIAASAVVAGGIAIILADSGGETATTSERPQQVSVASALSQDLLTTELAAIHGEQARGNSSDALTEALSRDLLTAELAAIHGTQARPADTIGPDRGPR